MNLVRVCCGRSVSVGKSKLCHKMMELELLRSWRIRFPVSRRDNWSGFDEAVFVDQTMD